MSTATATHPVVTCMADVIPSLTPLCGPFDQIRGLGVVFNVHNAVRRSAHCIARYMATFSPQSDVAAVQQAAKECRQWVDWYMPFLHHHHHTEDDYWFPTYRKVLTEAGVPEADVNSVFDRWDAEHKGISQREETMTRDLDATAQVTREQLSQVLTSCQQSSRAFADYISAHLSSEEQYLIQKLINENRVTEEKAKELSKTFSDKHLRSFPIHVLMDNLAFFMIPLGSEQEQIGIKNILPFPVRFYYNWWARPSYIKRAPRLYLLAHGLVSAL